MSHSVTLITRKDGVEVSVTADSLEEANLVYAEARALYMDEPGYVPGSSRKVVTDENNRKRDRIATRKAIEKHRATKGPK